MKIQKFFFSFTVALISLFYCRADYCQSLNELLNKGDNYLGVEFDNQKALDTFQNADKLFPNNWEVYWRLSRTYVYIAEKMPDNSSEQKDTQLTVYQKAYDYANIAVKLAPDKSVTYVRRAVANGRIALFKGFFLLPVLLMLLKLIVKRQLILAMGGITVKD